MAAIGLNWEEAKKICPPDISLACHNSTDSVTISGPVVSLKKFVEMLKSKNIFAKMVKCSGIAFHSKYVALAECKLHAWLDVIIPNPKQRSDRWISSSIPEDAWNTPLAQFSSSKYHVNNMLSPVLFREAIAHIPKNAITIEIAPHCLLQGILRKSLPSTVINTSLQKWNHSNNLFFLLCNVGKLYIAGAQPDVSKLYPPISFPVCLGTPMLGSLVKWDHSATWEVPDNKHKSEKWSGEHVVEINLSTETDAYLAGHKIDGRIIFPGAGLALMVWKTFAKLRNTDFEQLPIIFENLWFQRITFIHEKKTIKFSISILERTGDFVVHEAGTVVFSGNIRAAERIDKDRLDLLSLPIPPVEKELLLLNIDDIYKELRLRGYEYNGIFKGIKSCDSNFNIGEIHWFNEWSSYIDNMFQLKLLASDRELVYASKIRYAAIDPVSHKRLIDELRNDDGLPVYYYKNIDIVKSGGIEIRDSQTTASQRQQIQTRPKYERYVFIPYENPRSLDLKDPIKGKVHALTVLLQIVRENTTTLKIKAMEVAGNRAASRLLAPLVLDIIYDETLFDIDLQIAANSASDYTTNFNQMKANVNVVTWDANNIYPAQNMHLIIAAEVLSDQSCTILRNLTTALKSNGFILLEETAPQLELKTALRETDLMLVGKQIDSSGKSYLLLKKRRKRIEPIVIQITGKDFSWLENAKAVLKKFDRESQEVLFVSQGEESLGLTGFMTCIRRETTNARYVFIQDSNAPKFDLSSQFYVEQLDKELTANVLKGDQWGSYRHLQLDLH
ncbi:fatty acid synthase, partial [Lasius niger]